MPRPVQHPRQAPRGTACNVACGILLPLSTSRKHVPVTAGAQVHLGPGHEAAERGRAWASRRARRGRVSAADVGAPRAAQPERAGRGVHLGHERRGRPASQRASREAMLLPEGDEHRLQRLEPGQFLPARDLDDRLPLPLVAGKGRRAGRGGDATPGSVFTRRRHAARVPGLACALPSPSGPPPAHHAALRRAGLMAPEAVGRQCP